MSIRAMLFCLSISLGPATTAVGADAIGGGAGTKAVLTLSGVNGTYDDSALDFPQDKDWYRLSVVAPHTYIVVADNLRDYGQVNVDLSLLNAGAKPIFFQPADNSSIWGYDFNITAIKFKASTSTVFVGLSASGPTTIGRYQVRLFRSCANDTTTNCKLVPGQTVITTRTDDNLPWYRIRLIQGHRYATRYHGSSLRLRGGNGQAKLERDCYVDECSFTSPGTGLYFLEVGIMSSDPHASAFSSGPFILDDVTADPGVTTVGR